MWSRPARRLPAVYPANRRHNLPTTQSPGIFWTPGLLPGTIRRNANYLYIALMTPHELGSTGVNSQYVVPVRKIVYGPS